MKRKAVLIMTTLAVLWSGCAVPAADACTTTIVTKGASADGSAYVTHSNDSFSSDPSIVYVPAKDHPAGSVRKVYPSAIAWDDLPEYNCTSNPRLVAPERAPGYDYPGLKQTKPLGEIPQAAHTYAYIDSDYGVMNEKGLMLGECTNNSLHLEYLEPKPGRGIFYASELGRVALERCSTAREAVRLMGSLIDTYGLWGTGETLLVADKEEGWVLEMQPTPSGKGGFWVAQRVPDGEFFVAANQFRIRSIKKDSPDQIFNPRLPEMLKEVGWAAYDKQGNIDWVRTMQAAEDFHPYFALRRVWRAMSLVAPSAKLPSKVRGWDTEKYPFSIRPDHPLTLAEIMDLHRDAYENTAFDRTKGENAGMFASPYRYGSKKWERSITTRNIAYTWITQFNDKLPAPIFWLSVNAPAESVYVPLAVAPLPEAYEKANREKFDLAKAWWITGQVTMLTRGYYSAFSPEVRAAAHKEEQRAAELVKASSSQSAETFAQTLRDNAQRTLTTWHNLYGNLLVSKDADHRIDYDAKKSETIKQDKVTKY
ncbi:MAG: C69 family dipeptidase [Succiniclasticum sp.]|uniref:C69 family dipeptidase n=1 Tax=Succiniclasticum sp. TaxID=2775030 RepID=UPI002A919650|nr:C69 family dipeptidase [Succiniclasticum sp.]MDY6291290.1 C69 family dipeptidase [Succiniclasticum sp.]